MPNTFMFSELIGKDVFTDRGAYCGKLRDIDIDISKYCVRAVVVDASKGSYLAKKVGGKRGVIVPYSMVKAIEDVIVIKHFSLESVSEEKEKAYYEKQTVQEEE
jgi:sporulation protein YlmC with PRC-barrel domain